MFSKIIIDRLRDKWMEATKQNFPGIPEDHPGRWGFVGHPTSDDIAKRHVRHRLPDFMRKKGAANPIRYVFEIVADQKNQ
jgi:hypothetical protein